MLDPLEDLPTSLGEALLRLDKAVGDLVADLKIESMYAIATPCQLKSGDVRNCATDTGYYNKVVRRRGKQRRDALLKLFDILLDPSSIAVNQIGTLSVVNEVQRLINLGIEAKKRSSAFVYDMFSDLALVAYIGMTGEQFSP